MNKKQKRVCAVLFQNGRMWLKTSLSDPIIDKVDNYFIVDETLNWEQIRVIAYAFGYPVESLFEDPYPLDDSWGMKERISKIRKQKRFKAAKLLETLWSQSKQERKQEKKIMENIFINKFDSTAEFLSLVEKDKCQENFINPHEYARYRQYRVTLIEFEEKYKYIRDSVANREHGAKDE